MLWIFEPVLESAAACQLAVSWRLEFSDAVMISVL